MQIQQYKTVNVGIGRRRLFRVGNVVIIWIRIGSPAWMASWLCGPAIRLQRVLKSAATKVTFEVTNVKRYRPIPPLAATASAKRHDRPL